MRPRFHALVDCPACDSPVSRTAPACPRCGHPVRDDMARGAVLARSDGSGPAAASDTLALAGLVCGVGSAALLLVPFEFSWLAAVTSPLAVVLSSVALARVGRGEASGRGMAMTGLVLGLLVLLVAVAAAVWVFWQAGFGPA